MKDIKKEIYRWRKCIDTADRKIVKLLNQRASYAGKIGQLKVKLNLDVYAKNREKEVLKNAAEANSGPLSGKAIVRLYKRIIEESRGVEHVAMNAAKKQSKRK